MGDNPEKDPFNLKSLKSNGFAYFVHRHARSSKQFSPYELVKTHFNKIDKNGEYFTVSLHGVTSFSSENKPEIVSLQNWHREKGIYNNLKQLKFFGTFQKWRAFCKWRKSVSAKKFEILYHQLPSKVLLLDTTLRPSVIMCQDICSKLRVMGLGKDFEEEPVPLSQLMESQIKNLKEIKWLVQTMRDTIKDQLLATCKVQFERQGLPSSTACSTRPSSAHSGSHGKKSKQAEMKQTLSYADQEKRRVLSERLARFIRLIDCLMQSALHSVLLNSYKEFVATVEARFQSGFYDNFERLPCLCIVKVLIEEENLSLSPSELEMTNTLRRLFQSWEDAVNAFELFSNDQTLSPYLRSNACKTSLENIVTRDENIALYKSRMLQILQENFCMASDFTQRYSKVKDSYLANTGTDLDSVSNETDLNFFKQILQNVQEQEQELEKIENSHSIGILELRMFKLKAIANPSVQELKTFVNALLPKIGRTKVNKLSAEVQDAQAFLELVPKTTSNFVEFLHYLDKTVDKLPNMHKEIEYVEELFETMKQFNVVCMKEDVNSFTVFQKGLASLKTSVEKRVSKRQEIVQNFELAIQADVRQLIGEINAVQTAANEPALLEVESDFEEVQLVLHQLKTKLADFQRKNDYFQLQKDSFQIEIAECKNLEVVKRSVELRQLLWDSLESWTARLEDWDVQPFDSLEPRELNEFISSNFEIILKVQSGLPENSVIQKYQSSVEQMKAKLPVIENLRNENLEERHWKEMSSLVKHNLHSGQNLTLKILEDMEVFAFLHQLRDISIRATCEARLKNKLEKVMANLEALEFELRVYKDTYLLVESEDFNSTLNETCTALGEIANSVFAAPIQARVDETRKKFQLFTLTNENMWNFQNKWCKIDSIFEPDEVKIKLSMECKMLLEATKVWKFIMQRVYNTSSAMEALVLPGILSRVLLTIKMLNQIEESLQAYFESRRVVFQRFYFLSNREMFNMWAEASQAESVEKYLPKMFPAVRKIDFKSDSEGRRFFSSVEDHKLNSLCFDKSIVVTRKFEDWLCKLEFSIGKYLKYNISSAIKEFANTANLAWIEKYPDQVLTTARIIKFTKSVEDGLKVISLKVTTEELEKELESYTLLLKTNELALNSRHKIIKLIQQLIHFTETLRSLASEEDLNSSSFGWQKTMRFYWNDEQKECWVKMGPAILKYGFEFISSDDVFINSAESDRVFLNIFLSIKLGLANFVHGEEGKKYLIQSLANALAKHLIQIPCSGKMGFQSMLQILSGSIQSGAWCCFSEINSLDRSTLSIAAQNIDKILNATKHKLSRFTLEGREIGRNSHFALFLCASENKIIGKLPRNLVKLFRPVHVEAQNKAKLVETALRCRGRENAKIEAQKICTLWDRLKNEFENESHCFFKTRNLFGALDFDRDVEIYDLFQNSVLTRLTARVEKDKVREMVSAREAKQEISDFEKVLEQAALNLGIVATPSLLENIKALHELAALDESIILCGEIASGKTTTWKLYLEALNLVDNKNQHRIIYPGMHAEEEFSDSQSICQLLELTIRNFDAKREKTALFVIFDGELDARWTQFLGQIFEARGLLFTNGGERIFSSSRIKFIFETTSLKNAPPAIVGRCNILNLKGGVKNTVVPFVKAELSKFTNNRNKSVVESVQQCCEEMAKSNKIAAFAIARALILLFGNAVDKMQDKTDKGQVQKMLAISFKLGAEAFRQNDASFEGLVPDLDLSDEDLDGAFCDDIPPSNYFTAQEMRKIKVAKLLLNSEQPILISGATGRGKTVTLKMLMDQNKREILSHLVKSQIHGPSRTELQKYLVLKLEKRSAESVGAPFGKKTNFLIDDFHLSKQPQREFLRLLQDHHAIYDTQNRWVKVQDVNFALGANSDFEFDTCPRLERHFCHLHFEKPSRQLLLNIYRSRSEQFEKDGFAEMGNKMTELVVSIFEKLKAEGKEDVALTLLDLEACIPIKNRLIVANNKLETGIIRAFQSEVVRIFGSKFFSKSANEEAANEINSQFLNTFGENVVQEKRETCELSEILSAEKNCTHDVSLSPGATLNAHFESDLSGQKFTSFNKFAEMSLKVARALMCDQKNVLLLGNSGVGKRTVAKTAAKLLNFRLEVIDLVDLNYEETKSKLRSACLESLRLKTGLVVVLNFDGCLSLESDSSRDVFNLIRYGHTSFFYEKDFIAESLRLIEGIAEGAINKNHADEDQEVLFIAEYVKKNVRFALSVHTDLENVTDLEIGRYCFVQYVNQWEPGDYEEICISTLKIGSYESKFANAEGIEKCLARIHVLAHESYKSCKQTLFVTFDMFIDFLSHFNSFYELQLHQLKLKRDKCAQSIKKLEETFKMAEEMKEDLSNMIPRLKEKRQLCENIVKALSVERTHVEKMRQTVQTEESTLKEKSDDARSVSTEIQRELEDCIPAIEASCKAMELIERNELKDVKSTNKPASLLRLLMEPVCILLDCKADWGSAKALAADANFIKKAMEVDKEGVDDATCQKLKEYVDNPNFLPEIMEGQSKFCRTLCMWVRSIYNYVKVYRNLLPKKRRLELTEGELRVAMSKLKGHQQKLADTEAKVAALEMSHDQCAAEADALQNAVQSATLRLSRAAQLASALQDFVAWKIKLKVFNEKIDHLCGDVMICAATVIYLGPLHSEMRKNTLGVWIQCCAENGIKTSEDFSFVEMMASPSELHLWHSNKLLKDEHSTTSAIIAEKSQKLSMIVDPQDQASQWIRQIYSAQGLLVTSVHNPQHLQLLAKNMEQNLPILLQDVDEKISPNLIKLLNGQSQKNIFLSTRLAKPDFPADAFSAFNIVDFTVQPEGLEDMFVGEIIRMKALDIENQLNTFGSRLRAGKRDLDEIESEMQDKLCQFKADLVDDETAINYLCKSKASIDGILTNRERHAKSWKSYSDRKNQYQCVAKIASDIFCGLLHMQNSKQVYQFSLQILKDKLLELVKKKFSTDEFDTLLQAIEEFSKIVKKEMLKLNLESFNFEDLQAFCLFVASRFSKTNNRDELPISETSMVDQLGFEPRKQRVDKAGLKNLIKTMKKLTPMALILGQDITKELRALAEEIRVKGSEDGLIVLSMGKGPSEKAEFWLRKAAEKGFWIYFQNCHLSPEWLEKLEQTLYIFKADSNLVHENFRLFFSTITLSKLPPVLVQSSVKFSTELLENTDLEIKST